MDSLYANIENRLNVQPLPTILVSKDISTAVILEMKQI